MCLTWTQTILLKIIDLSININLWYVNIFYVIFKNLKQSPNSSGQL